MLNLELFNSFLSWRMKKRFNQIDWFMREPEKAQDGVLKELVEKAARTEWGQRYGFSSVDSYDTFRERVPLHDYEDIEGEVNRIRSGEQNILWPTEIKWFAKSSGTTSSKSKFIPVSPEALEECHFKGGKDMLSIYCNNYEDTKIFTGLSLKLGGSTSVNIGNNSSYYGDLSAVIIENLPFWANILSTPNNKVSLMGEWEEKIETIAKNTIKENVTSLAGVPSWMLVLCKRVLELTGKKDLHEVWPNLEAYMHGGVNFSPYRSQFENLMPRKKINYLETYNASEGFFGIQDLSGSNDMLLMLDYGIFYEFIPLEDFGTADAKAIPIQEVEKDTNYAMVISTNAGLWRYVIGDTVTFTSLRPYRIHITGRTKHFINAFGEEVIIDNAEKALKRSAEETDCEITEYTAAPVYMDEENAGAHEWLIEFNRPPADLEDFTEKLDKHLKSLNSDYEAKRYKNMALKPPVVHSARPGLFYRWLKAKGKLGGQHKVPRLSNNRQYIDELLAMNRS